MIILVHINKSKTNLSVSVINSLIIDSIKLLFKNPILFLPKILIAFLYGLGALLAVDLSKQLFLFQSLTSDQILNFDFTPFFISLFLLFGLAILTFFIDLFFSGFYPILVSLAEKNKLSFKEGFKLFKPKLFSVLISGVFLWLLITVISIIEAVVILYFNFSDIGVVLSFIITLIFVFVFYFLYPKIIFEDSKLTKIFIDSVLISLKNKKLVFILSLIPFLVSVIKFILAYFSDSTLYLIIFWLLVLLTGLIYSVHAVVNQLSYIKISNSKK